MRVQLISDVHTELHPDREPPERDADLLILAGDIGVFVDKEWQTYVNTCAKRWDTVLFIAGNHEYYNSSKDMRTLELMAVNACRENKWENVFFLHNSSVTIQGWQFFGLTGWTTLDTYFSGHTHVDFKRINAVKYQKLNPVTQTQKANYGMQKLKEFLQTHDGETPVVIITHFQPVRWPDDFVDDLTDCFAWRDLPSELSTLPGYRYIRAWCYGHTHRPMDVVRDHIRFLSRPQGYEDEMLPLETAGIEIGVARATHVVAKR